MVDRISARCLKTLRWIHTSKDKPVQTTFSFHRLTSLSKFYGDRAKPKEKKRFIIAYSRDRRENLAKFFNFSRCTFQWDAFKKS